jgi:protein SCO1
MRAGHPLFPPAKACVPSPFTPLAIFRGACGKSPHNPDHARRVTADGAHFAIESRGRCLARPHLNEFEMPYLSQLRREGRLVAATLALCAVLTACSRPAEPWRLTDVSGHLPDLSFSLVDDDGRAVHGESFAGRATLVYFGYTHCPDVCPETMARLMQVLQLIGADANRAQIVFITVDPARDTPAALHAYVRAFDSQHAVGLTGSDRAIESLAKRYRVAYQAEKRGAGGTYEVTHSSAVYIFDVQGHARLLATDNDSVDAIAHDLRRVIESTQS